MVVPDTPEWMKWAACRDTFADIFFPEKGCSAEEAKRVCGNCPVVDECLDHALKHDEKFGVWGGTSEKQRWALRKKLRPARRAS